MPNPHFYAVPLNKHSGELTQQTIIVIHKTENPVQRNIMECFDDKLYKVIRK